jgi:transposase-like protein
MAQAYATGDYTLAEIARHFDVHYSTVSRAVTSFRSAT